MKRKLVHHVVREKSMGQFLKNPGDKNEESRYYSKSNQKSVEDFKEGSKTA